ncbi:hypothetical protein [Aquipuribacter sp. MA13-6]|uniref:hypothetical protein n=1 Tax=unclassified Aquipuribacter TaxID=2635084 RepID=UPI003EE8B420
MGGAAGGAAGAGPLGGGPLGEGPYPRHVRTRQGLRAHRDARRRAAARRDAVDGEEAGRDGLDKDLGLDADLGEGGAVPDDVMAPTRMDAVTILVLWGLRRAFYPLLLVGLAFAWIAGEVTPVALVRLENPLQLVAALATPLAGIAVALTVRLLVGLLALAAAFPRTRWVSEEEAERDAAGHRRGPVRRWVDRVYMTAAYRELRSTWTVRGRATSQLGRSGRWLTGLNVLLWGVTAAAAVAFVWAVVATPDLVWLAPGG